MRASKAGASPGTPFRREHTAQANEAAVVMDREAQAKCASLITAIKGGSYVEPSKQTVAEFLEEWLTFIKPSVSPKTHERYAEICRKTIAPQIGAVILSKLKTDRIDAALSEMLTAGRRGAAGGGGRQR